MVDPVAASRHAHQLLFLAIAATFLFVRLLPLSAMPARFPGPDLMLCLTLAWVQRRPDYVPALLIVAVFLFDDILSMRPPGLWPLVVLLGTEFLRSRLATLRDLPFAVEWLTTAGLIVVLSLANWLILSLVMVPQAGFGPMLLQALATIAAYPIVVAITLFAFGVRKTTKGETNASGRRL